jgi:hypothetical protein
LRRASSSLACFNLFSACCNLIFASVAFRCSCFASSRFLFCFFSLALSASFFALASSWEIESKCGSVRHQSVNVRTWINYYTWGLLTWVNYYTWSPLTGLITTPGARSPVVHSTTLATVGAHSPAVLSQNPAALSPLLALPPVPFARRLRFRRRRWIAAHHITRTRDPVADSGRYRRCTPIHHWVRWVVRSVVH